MPNVDLEKIRISNLRKYAIKQSLERLDAEVPGFEPEEIVASICAYEEELNNRGGRSFVSGRRGH